jgi:hypothetical protein
MGNKNILNMNFNYYLMQINFKAQLVYIFLYQKIEI